MRGAIARQRAGMQCHPGPGDPLHKGHLRVVVEVGHVVPVLLQNSENACRRFITPGATGNRRLQDRTFRIVDGDFLLLQADQRQNRRSNFTAPGNFIPAWRRRLPCLGAERKCCDKPRRGNQSASPHLRGEHVRPRFLLSNALTQASAIRCEGIVTLRSFLKRERQLWRQSFRAYVNFSGLRARLVSPNWGTLFFETMGLT